MPSALGLLVLAKRGPMLGDAMTGATRHACRAMIYSSQPLKRRENMIKLSLILVGFLFLCILVVVAIVDNHEKNGSIDG